MPAEQVMDDVAAELVVRQRLLALQQSEGGRHDDRLPEAAFAAGGAIAFAGAIDEVELAFAANRAAMAAAAIGLLHDQRSPARYCARRSMHSLQPSLWESRCSMDSKNAWR